MILYRSGQSFRIAIVGASDEQAKACFASERTDEANSREVVASADQMTLQYRRWWAERQPEVCWAETNADGAYAIDVSHVFWWEKCFLITFELAADASRFALLFLGRDQAECEAAVWSRR